MASASKALLLLLADSQLLFASGDRDSIFPRVRAHCAADAPRMAYLGASNGDEPAFFELFRDAAAASGPVECRHIPAQPNAAERAFLTNAEVILLAGGDAERGWRAFVATGIDAELRAVCDRGAVLIGISAGAMQMGAGMLELVPALIDVHDEKNGWSTLRAALQCDSLGLVVPSGTAVVVDGECFVPIGQPMWVNAGGVWPLGC